VCWGLKKYDYTFEESVAYKENLSKAHKSLPRESHLPSMPGDPLHHDRSH